MKKMFMKKLAVVAMAAAVVFTTVAPVISNPTTIEAATKKATKLKKARFKSSAISLNEGGNVIWVSGVKLSAKKNVTLYLNDKKTTQRLRHSKHFLKYLSKYSRIPYTYQAPSFPDGHALMPPPQVSLCPVLGSAHWNSHRN